MSERFPAWLRDVLRRRRFTQDTAASLRAALASDQLTVTHLRLVLLQDLTGRLTADVRRELLEWLGGRAELATSIVAQHVQVANLPKPQVVTRRRSSSLEVQVRLEIAEHLQSGGWRSGANPKVAEHRAHLSLLMKLCSVADDESDAPKGSSSSKARTRMPQSWSGSQARAAKGLGDPSGALALILAKGWDLLYDAAVCPSNPQLLLLPPDHEAMDRDLATIGLQSRRHRVQRTILRPGQLPSLQHCLLVELSEAVALLTSPRDCSGWTDATLVLADIARTASNWVAEDRIMPTISDAYVCSNRRPSWRIGPLSADHESSLMRWARSLGGMPKCLRTAQGEPEITDSTETTREFVDAVAEHFAPAIEQWLAKSQIPLPRLTTPNALDVLQDWADDLEAGNEGLIQTELVLRIDAPDVESDQPSVLSRLFIRSRAGTLVAAEDVWRNIGELPRPDPRLRLRIRCLLRHAGRLFPPLRALGDQFRPTSLLVGMHSVAAVRGRLGPKLAELGIQFEWDNDWLSEVRPQVLVGTQSFTTEPDGTLGLAQVLDRRWQLTVDGDLLTNDEMRLLAQAVLPLIRLRNRWVLVDDSTRQKARNPQIEPVEGPAAVLHARLGTVEIDGVEYACTSADGLAHLLYQLDQIAEDDRASQSGTVEHLHGLHKHQRAAVAWLERIGQLGFNGLLADDMGIGKTMSALGFHRSSLRPHHDLPTLVVCPNGDLVRKWVDDAAVLMPDLHVLAYWGPRRRIPAEFDEVVVTTYNTLARDLEDLAGRRWGLLVADEAQRIKNPRTYAAQAIRRIHSSHRLALSGTPLENHPRELFAILDWLNPELFGTRAQFEARFVAPLRQLAGTAEEELHRDRVHQMMGLVLLRRTKADPAVVPNLPGRQDFIHRIDMSSQQRAMLEALGIDTDTQFSLATSLKRSGEALLRLIEAARQVCNSPAHYRGDPAAAIVADPRRAAIEAPKLARLGEILNAATDHGDSALVFTPYAVMANLIHAYLAGIGLESYLYHGSVNRTAKRQALEAIKSEQARILVVTVGSGGVGLDLVRPNHVVHYDRDWSPAKEDQASDRVHRIGQRREVQVHHLLHAHSIEEHIAAKHLNKRRYATHFLPTVGSAVARPNPRELASLFELDRR